MKKKNGSYRLVVDYRGLNKQIEKTIWPLPRMNNVIDSLDGNCYFSNIDLTSGYFQMALDEESQNGTAFVTPMGLYKWKRLPMGLASAPGDFQNLMEFIMSGLSYEVALVYLEDIISFGRSFEEHLNRLDLVLGQLKDAGLKIKGSKGRFFQENIHFLGHIVSNKGVEVDPEKVVAVSKMKSLRTIKESRAILGLVGFYRRFIQDFGKVAEPLYKLLNKKDRFTWSKECESAVEQLKQALQKAPILGYPNDTDPYTLTSDASLFGIGAIISQIQQWAERVIAYASKTLSKCQRNYSATKRELYFFQHFRNYLLGQKFLIVTDLRALTWLYSFTEPDGIWARWIEKLGQFDFEIKHEAGKKIPHADCLSRVPQTEDQVKDCDQVNQINTEEKNIWSIGLGKSVEQLVVHQKNAADLIILRNWIENGKRPQRKHMAGASRALWKIWTDFRKLRIENDLIKRQKRIDEFKNLTQIFIQRSLLKEILPFFHEHCGHFGMVKTFDRVRERL